MTSGLPFSVATPLWSISVEEQFYLGWPLLLRFFGMNRIKQLAVGMLALGLTVRGLLAAFGVEGSGVWCNTLARLDPLLWAHFSRSFSAVAFLKSTLPFE